MQRHAPIFAFAVLILCDLGLIQAQSPYARKVPPPKPVVSPYLNLFRSGNSTAFNYLTLVRPELEMQKSITQLQGDVQTLNTAQGSTGSDFGETGHKVGYQTHTRYFMTMGSRVASPGAAAAAPRTSGTTPFLGGRGGAGTNMGAPGAAVGLGRR